MGEHQVLYKRPLLVRSISAAIALVLVATNIGGAYAGQVKKSIANAAIIEEGPAMAGSYNTSHTVAFKQMCATYAFKCRVVDNVNYPQAAQTLQSLASQGMNLIVANSNGYADALIQVAPQHPKVWFVMTSDITSTKGNKNVAGFIQDWQQFGFLGGAAAGYLSKKGTMGYVVGQPLTAAQRMISGFAQGARLVKPHAKLLVRYTNSWTDTGAAKEAAIAEIGSGADVVTAVDGGGNPGVIEAAQEKKVDYIGYLADEYKSAPGRIPTSMVVNVHKIYTQIGHKYTTHTLKPKLYVGTVANGIIRLAPLRGVPASTKAKIFAVVAKVRSGAIRVKETLYPVH
ncbi:MAG: BMP family protein [Chloroflexota bacterium]|nr:MAG: hypothetical protein DLM70_03470 [Chloroflexota bacterium]